MDTNMLKEKLKKFMGIELITEVEYKFLIDKIDFKVDSFEAFYVWEDGVYKWDDFKPIVLEWMADNSDDSVVVNRIAGNSLDSVRVYKDFTDIDVDLDEDDWNSEDEYELTYPDGSKEDFHSEGEIEDAIRDYIEQNSNCDTDDFSIELTKKCSVSVSITGSYELEMEFLNK